jgi:hypothetical protein
LEIRQRLRVAYDAILENKAATSDVSEAQDVTAESQSEKPISNKESTTNGH